MTDYQLAHEHDLQIIADQRKAITELRAACKAAQCVWEQGCVDRGYKDEHNWIDEAKDLIDTALANTEQNNDRTNRHEPA